LISRIEMSSRMKNEWIIKQILFFFLSFLLPLQLPQLSFSQSPDPLSADDVLRARVTRVSRSMRDEEDRLKRIKTDSQGLEKNIKLLEQQKDSTIKDVALLSSEIGSREGDLGKLNAEVLELRKKLDTRRDSIRLRARQLYKTSRSKSLLTTLFDAQSLVEFQQRAKFLKTFAKKDRQLFDQFGEDLALFEKQQDLLEKVRDDLLARKEKLQASKNSLETLKKESVAKLLQLQTSMKLQEQLVEKLKVSAEELESSLTAFLNKSPKEEPTKKPSLENKSGKKNSPASESKVSESKLEEVKVLAVLKGKFMSPVSGDILEHYGKQKHDEYLEQIFIKGVEIGAHLGDKVLASQNGTVVLSQPLPAFGNVVIIEHEKGVHTLYGRLASSVVTVGNQLKAGDIVGYLGEPDYKGRNFYFEFRRDGKAVDPIQYVQFSGGKK
jgi:murein hydrolase activator